MRKALCEPSFEALVSHLVQGDLNLLLAGGVVAAGVVVGGVLLARDQLTQTKSLLFCTA